MLRWVYSFGTSAKQPNKLQSIHEYVSVEVSLLCGEHTILRIEPTQQLCTVFDLITNQFGVQRSCQSLVVSETRRRSKGLGAAASEICHSWRARKSTQSLVLGLVNYMFLPQVVGREFGQRGLYHWAKAGLEGFRERPQGTTTLLVHKLDGLVLSLDMPGESSLEETQALVQQQTGILLDRQRISIEECLPPSRLSQLSNQLLLGSLQGIKAAAQVAQWASHRLMRRAQGLTAHQFPLAVTTQLGQTVTVNATMDMTVAELQNAVYANMSAAPTQPASHFPIQQVTFDHKSVSAGKNGSDGITSASAPVSTEGTWQP
ncbi:hypothetical protein ABBQ38_012372 [Trebouxia sp. C0009 RCD-2024]